MQHWVATIGCLSQSWAFPNIFFNLQFHFKVQYLDRKTKPIGSKLVTPPKWRIYSWSRYCTTFTFLFPPLTLMLCDSGRDNTLTLTEMEGFPTKTWPNPEALLIGLLERVDSTVSWHPRDSRRLVGWTKTIGFPFKMATFMG